MTRLDYADQRFYASTYGRFNTPDPARKSARRRNPESWNRYAYTLGDPVNRRDRKGLDSEDCGAAWVSDASLSGPCLVDGYASIDLSAVMQSACNQMIMAYGPVPVTDPACNSYASLPEQNAPSTPTCEQTETAYVYSYLGKYNSPLAAYASWIVTQSDLYGVDDRFVVALAGVESTYGKTQQTSPTWGYYNAFSNSLHCIALSAYCKAVNPYGSYGQAISGVISQVTGSLYFGSNLTTTNTIYPTYQGPGYQAALQTLNTIYVNQLGGGLVPGNNTAVNFARCP